MKKIISVLLTIMMIFAVTSCSDDSNKTDNGANTQTERKALVVYFSCTGNTENLADEIVKQTGADKFEIIPEVPYTDEDINYRNDDCRANKEMNDESARPAISGEISNLEEYDVIYVGFPIWHGTMPRIMNTLFDTYDFGGKTIMPFCTSGSSGISNAVADIKSAEAEATVKDGLQIAGTSSGDCEEAVKQWIDENK